MSGSRWLFRIAFLVWAVLALVTAIFILPKSYYDLPDVFFTMTSLMTVHQLGMHHMDFASLVRAGYLLNYPFYAMGFSIGWMRAVYFAVLFLCAAIFYFSIERSKSDRWLLPVMLMISFLTAACYYRFMFNYYSVPAAFLMAAIGFCFWGEKSKFCLFPVLSALAFTIIGFAGLPLLLMCLLAVIALSLAQWNRQGLILFLSFIIFTLFVGWAFFIHWGVLDRLLHLSGSMSAFPKTGNKYPIAVLVWSAAFSLLAAGLVFYILIYRFKQAKGSVLLLMLVAYIGIFAALSCDVLYHEKYDIYGSIYWLAFGLIAFGAMGICYPKVHESRWNRLYITALVVVALFAGYNRSYSRAYHILFIYLPVIFLIALAYLNHANQLSSFSRKLLIVCITFVGVVIFGINRFNFLEIHDYYIELNNTYVPAIDLYTTPNTAEMFNGMLKAYQNNDCAHKAYLAMDDIPSAYWLVKRTPPFNQAWISRLLVLPYNKQTSGPNIIRYLMQEGSWCVFYTTDSGVNSIEKAIGREKILPFLKQAATKQIYIGAFSHRVNNGPLPNRPMGVTLYVR